ncbi:MAG: filamentous hemagglutinin N-terminal domain-containing protein [Stenomitos frigidus ULC029]
MRKPDLHFWSIGTFALGLLSSLGTVQAQVVPDNTLPVNSRVPPGCVVCTIDDGTVRGVNLYHSFREFSIPTGGEAYFNNAALIQNILTRVTGASISNIDGLIRANGIANLYLLNPNGFVFGPNARLNIGGSFVATTANRFQFPDGSTYSAINPQAPPLLTVNVSPGVQFDARPAGSTITNRGNLSTGQDLTLDANRLDLQGQLQAGRDLTL